MCLLKVVAQEHQHQNRAKTYRLPHSTAASIQVLPHLQGR